MSIWDDDDLKVSDDFVKFEEVGDSVVGTITAIRKHRFADGDVAAQVLLKTDSGEEKTLTVGQVRLKLAFAEQRPEVGDHIAVTLTQLEPRGGKKVLKHFALKVTKGDEKPPF